MIYVFKYTNGTKIILEIESKEDLDLLVAMEGDHLLKYEELNEELD